MSIRLQPVDLCLSSWTPTTFEANQAEAGEFSKEPSILSTPLESLTTCALDGSGVFDKLMAAAKLHLKEEYDASRITGNDFSQLYLGTMSAVLQTSIQFLLNQQQAHEINARIGLIRQQTVTELANTCDSVPHGLGFNHIPQDVTAIPPIAQVQQ